MLEVARSYIGSRGDATGGGTAAEDSKSSPSRVEDGS